MTFAVLIFIEGFAEDNNDNKQSLVPRPKQLFNQQLKKFHMQLIKFLSSAVKKLDVIQKFLNAYHYFQIITLFNCQTTGFLWLELRPIKKLIGSHQRWVHFKMSFWFLQISTKNPLQPLDNLKKRINVAPNHVQTYDVKYTDRNFVDNFLQLVIYLALVANIQRETWKKIVLQVNCYTLK